MARKPDPWLPTRHTLLARLKDKSDDLSWQAFFDRYARLIYSVAALSGLSHVESQEVVQETVLSVSKKIDQFRADPSAGSFKAWLRRLIQWRVLDQVRKRRPDAPAPSRPKRNEESTSTATEERIPDPTGGDFEAIWDREWEQQVMRSALERLKTEVNPEHYQIFQKAKLEQKPVKTVAEAFGITEDQVYVITHRLRKSLEKHIAEFMEKY